MPIRIDVKPDVREVKKLFRELGPGVERAAARALNDTIRTVRAEGAREIKGTHKALKIGDIKSAMKQHKAHQRSLTAWLAVSGRALSLGLFRPGGIGSRKGVSAVIGQSRVLMGEAKRRVFRIPAYGNEFFIRKRGSRGVRRIRGPSLTGVFRAAAAKNFERIARARFAKTFPSRLRFEIEKAERKARGV